MTDGPRRNRSQDDYLFELPMTEREDAKIETQYLASSIFHVRGHAHRVADFTKSASCQHHA